IPIFALVDTNCDPDEVDYVIPGNDDAIRAVKLIVGTLANAVAEALGGTPIEIEFNDEPSYEEKGRRPSSRRSRSSNRHDSDDSDDKKHRNYHDAKPVREHHVEKKTEPSSVEPDRAEIVE